MQCGVPQHGGLLRRKSLPPDHPDIATSLNNLGTGAV